MLLQKATVGKMKKLYEKPKFELKPYIRKDIIMSSNGDGWVNDPFTKNDPFSQG